MDVDEFVCLFPRLYHMAERDSWASIREHGLLSTCALLDFFEVVGNERHSLESARRPEGIDLCHPDFGRATLRDNKPMREERLVESLMDGLVPRDWYEILNRRCFFWVREERLHKLLKASAYRAKTHDVLTIDATTLVPAHLERIDLCPYNSGSTMPANPHRGLSTFMRMDDYPFQFHRTRNSQDPIVELTVEYSVPDIKDHTIQVRQMQGDTIERIVWER